MKPPPRFPEKPRVRKPRQPEQLELFKRAELPLQAWKNKVVIEGDTFDLVESNSSNEK